MLTKAIFILVELAAILNICITVKAMRHVKENYCRWLSNAMKVAIIALAANILITCAPFEEAAGIGFVLYFGSIDWIILCLAAFSLLYTEHHQTIRLLAKPTIVVMALDTISLALNPIFGHVFYVEDIVRDDGAVFYQTGHYIPFYIHLVICYIPLAAVLIAFIYRTAKGYSIYRVKYAIILAVLLLVILLNMAYMAFRLLVDASVVFYAVAGTLVYFCIQIFVPRSLMIVSISRAIDDMNEGMILFDISENCIYANAFSKQRFHMEEADFHFGCEPVRTILAQLAEKGQKYGEGEYVRQAAEENEEHYSIRYNELTDRRGRTIGSYFLIEDRTEEIRYLEEIRKAKNEADDANNAKSSFLANMSHEIRTPLNAILGMNEMILRTTEDAALREYAEDIRTSGDALLSLINDILDFSKIEAKRMDVVPGEYHLADMLRVCYNNFRQMAAEKDLSYRITVDETIPSELIGDVKLIRQILSNLISNAIKYTREGGVEIRVNQGPAEDGICNLIIDVADTGIGIAIEDLAILFDSFQRVNETENASIQGTGLGLAITKKLVELMEGTITVHSRPGEGSTFHVVLPQKISSHAPIGAFSTQVVTGGGKKYKESFHAPDATVLIVDDVAMNLKLETHLLKNTMVQVDTAEGGNRAIEMCKFKKYDLILMDHRMPSPDGIETFLIISGNGLNTDTPVVMLTANVVGGAEEEYRGLGFAGYLSKPVRPEELEKIMIQLLPPRLVERVL